MQQQSNERTHTDALRILAGTLLLRNARREQKRFRRSAHVAVQGSLLFPQPLKAGAWRYPGQSTNTFSAQGLTTQNPNGLRQRPSRNPGAAHHTGSWPQKLPPVSGQRMASLQDELIGRQAPTAQCDCATDAPQLDTLESCCHVRARRSVIFWDTKKDLASLVTSIYKNHPSSP